VHDRDGDVGNVFSIENGSVSSNHFVRISIGHVSTQVNLGIDFQSIFGRAISSQKGIDRVLEDF